MSKWYLVHWVNENKWDVYPPSKVPAEHRHIGALAMLPWNGEEYLGKIVAIENTKDKIEAAEIKFYKEMKEKEASVSSKRTSKERKRSGIANDNQVRKALGEKSKLTPEQEAAKKLEKAERKKKDTVRANVERSEDSELIHSAVKRKIEFTSQQLPTSEIVIQKTSTSNTVHDIMSDEEVSGGDSDADADIDGAVEIQNKLDNKDSSKLDIRDSDQLNSSHPLEKQTQHSDAEDDENEDDNYSQRGTVPGPMQKFCNYNTKMFLRTLMTQMGFDDAESELALASTSPPTKSSDEAYAIPRTVENQKMVPVKKGFKLLISKSARNKLLIDAKSQKTASVFVRKTLSEVYGESQLGSITALGRKKNKAGIAPDDLNAIYGFVNDHCPDKITWKDFITAVNKKCCSKRPKSSGKVSGTKSGKGDGSKSAKGESPFKSPRKTACSASQHTPLKSRLSNSPSKSSPRKGTPKKPSPEQFIVSDIEAPAPTAAKVPLPHQENPSQIESHQSRWLWPAQRQHGVEQQSAANYDQQYQQPCTYYGSTLYNSASYSNTANYPQQMLHYPLKLLSSSIFSS